MITIPIPVHPKPGRTPDLVLGRQYENNAVQFRFDCSKLAALHGDGTGRIYARRCEEYEAYPASDVEMDGTNLLWTVTAYDTQIPGEGLCELVWVPDDDTDASTRPILFRTIVREGVGESTGESAEVKSWLDTAAEYAERAEAAAEIAEEIASFTLEFDPETGLVYLVSPNLSYWDFSVNTDGYLEVTA